MSHVTYSYLVIRMGGPMIDRRRHVAIQYFSDGFIIKIRSNAAWGFLFEKVDPHRFVFRIGAARIVDISVVTPDAPFSVVRRIGGEPQADLFLRIDTFDPVSLLPRLVQCRQEHCRKNGDDRDNDQQFDERKYGLSRG